MSEAATSVAPAANSASTTGQTSSQTTTTTAATSASGATSTSAASTSWTDTLAPDLKEYVGSKGFKDPSAVLDSYRNLEKLRGVPQERLLKLPEAPDAPEWAEVYSKLGKPENPDGYGLQSSPKGDENFLKWAKETFYQNNLNKGQAQSLVQKFNEYAQQKATAMQTEYAEKVKMQELSLKKEWGSAYEQNMAKARVAAKQFGVPGEALDALEKAMGYDGVMKFFNKVSSSMGESTYHGGQQTAGFGPEGGALTPADARSKIEALKKDQSFVDRYTKGDVKAREQLTRLHQMAYDV